MSEQAVTPEPESAGTAPNGLMSEADAVAHVANLLSGEPPKERPPEEAKPAREEQEIAPEQEAQVEEETQEEQRREEEPTETELDDGDTQELPSTLESFAEALEMKAEDLAEYLKVPVKISGERSEVTLAEAIKGYQREGHYSRLMDEVAEQRRQIETASAEQQQQWQQKWQGLEDMASLLQTRLGSITPEMRQKILNEQGIEALKSVELEMERDQEALKQISAERERMKGEQVNAMTKYRSEQQRLLAQADPDFRDAEKSERAQREMAEYLKSVKFTDEDIAGYFGGPFDHRYVQVIRDAARWRALQQKAPDVAKKVKKTVPIMKKAGAASDGRKAPDKIAALRQRATKLTSEYAPKRVQEENAVALISEMIRK